LAPDVKPAADGLDNLLCWLCGCVMIYGSLFGIGKIVLRETATGAGMLAVAAVAGGVIYWNLTRRGWASLVD
jgi:prepilin signal peptidase PulO-like enzyme (type II secretory pathway)